MATLSSPLPARRRRAAYAALFAATFPLLAGCPGGGAGTTAGPDASPSPADRTAGAFAQTDPWLLTTTDPNAGRANHGIFLGNGYIGVTFGPNGAAGKDSVAYLAGHYGPDETLKPIPNWHNLGLPDPKPGEPYEQTLDMKRGVLTTKMGGVTVTAFVSAADPKLAVLRVNGAAMPAAEPVTTNIVPGWNFTVLTEPDADGNGGTKYIRFTDNRQPGRLPDLMPQEQEPGQHGLLLSAHEAAWAKRWEGRDIVIEGDPEAQQLVHKMMFDLLQSTRPGGADSVPPETLSGDFYKGHIFWDADIWIFPALLAQHPDLARNILDYRFRHLDAAKAKSKAEGFRGADFPWESAGTGRETAPGGFSKGRHVTAGVAWAHWQYYLATQDKKWLAERGWPVLSAVADFFASRAKKDPASGKFEIEDVTGPDELKQNIDNNTYTNALARYALRAAGEAAKVVGRPADPRWAQVADGLLLPFDKEKGVYLVREGDDGAKTKQADGELLLYPAKLPMDAATAEKTFAFHAARPIKNGPAMTDSIHALIAARLGRAGEAEQNFREAYRPFVRGPFLLFSEKRSLDRAVFATGAGGVLQAVLYGFGGLDWDDWSGVEKRPVALPPTWKRLTIRGVRRGGKVYTLAVTPEGRTLTEQK